MRHLSWTIRCVIAVTVITAFATAASAATGPGSLTFTNTPLVQPDGASEPAISIATDGTLAATGLQWLFGSTVPQATDLWTGPFGSTPTFRGPLDAGLQKSGKTVFSGQDADIDLGATGTLHATSLLVLINPPFRSLKVGVSAITCPQGTSPNLSLSNCTQQIIDAAGTDRPWITSDAARVWIAYHDAANSLLIHVQRSDDDGYTWKKVGDPLVGQGGATANGVGYNLHGPIVADAFSHNLYAVYAAGETGSPKTTTFAPSNIYVSRSIDGGQNWTAKLVYRGLPGTSLANTFPTLAADPTNGQLYAAWSDGHQVFFSASRDGGATWSPAAVANAAPASTAIFPWLAAYNGTADLVYYGTPAASKADSSAVWNVYLAQTSNGGATFAQSLVSHTSNHTGVICTIGDACAPGTRNLLDLFEVAINPQTGQAGIIYTDDTLTSSGGQPLPQIVLAQQNP